jgi:hypothetical protein
MKIIPWKFEVGKAFRGMGYKVSGQLSGNYLA